MSPHSHIIREFLRFSRPYALPLTLYMIAIPGSILTAAIALPLLLRELVDLLQSSQDPTLVSQQAFTIVLMIAATLSVSILFRLLADLSITRVNPYVFRDMEQYCFEKMIARSYGFFTDIQTGALVAKIRRYVDAYEVISFNLTRGHYVISLQFLFSLAVVGYYSLGLAALMVFFGIIFLIITHRLIAWKMTYDIARAAAESRTMGRLADTLSNFLAVKIFSQSKAETVALYVSASEAAEQLKQSWMASTKIELVQGVFMATVQVSIFFLALWFWLRGTISLGTIVMVQTYVWALCALLRDWGTYSKAVYRGLAAALEMSELLAQESEVKDPTMPEPVRMKAGQIEIQKITFGYHPDRPIFTNFSLAIAPGERIALVGSSGAGKTTLVKLILRFMDVNSGAIRIDNQAIAAITQDDLRRTVSFVPQEPILFHRTIYENIAYGSDAHSPTLIRAAAEKAYIAHFIDTLPNGAETIVGERGVKLSGGEKQRIAIARAMLRESPILILDEATNSLDSVSERFVQLAFQNLMQGRTTLVIAHRLSTIQMMDRIVVLDEGAIVETGKHEELLARRGHYYRFWREQLMQERHEPK
jgi:ABC-type multidrug transport system fused ATPase/permease subunit